MNLSDPLWKLSLSIGIGLLVTLFLEFPLRRLMRRISHQQLEPPAGIQKDIWLRSVSPSSPSGAARLPEIETGVRYLGRLERILFFFVILVGAYPVAGGWLAFKVASKWQAWSQVIKAPEGLTDDPLEELRARNAWGSLLFNRFMVGTLYNFLAGVVGVAIAYVVAQTLGI